MPPKEQGNILCPSNLNTTSTINTEGFTINPAAPSRETPTQEPRFSMGYTSSYLSDQSLQDMKSCAFQHLNSCEVCIVENVLRLDIVCKCK